MGDENNNCFENCINNSGEGENISVPLSVSKNFNCGAFFLSFFWGLFNKTYITFLILLLPSLCTLLSIFGISKTLVNIISLTVFLMLIVWFGKNGNKWAWQNKRFNSIEHFHKVQRKWAFAGWVITIVLSFAYLTIFILPVIYYTAIFGRYAR